MAWEVSTDNVTDEDTLWDWDQLIQDGTILFLPGWFIAQETIGPWVLLPTGLERRSLSMIAGEQKVLVFYPNPQPPHLAPNPKSLAGGTVTLKIAPLGGPTSIVNMTISATDPNPVNHYAFYRNLSSDFAAGDYNLQVEGVWPDGTDLKVPMFSLTVGRSL